MAFLTSIASRTVVNDLMQQGYVYHRTQDPDAREGGGNACRRGADGPRGYSSDEILELMRRSTASSVAHSLWSPTIRIADRCNRIIEIVDGLVKSDRVRSGA